jgi:hypothetical protein
MGLSDGAFFMIKHTPLPNGNHPISSSICPMGVADTLGHSTMVSVCIGNPLQKFIRVHKILDYNHFISSL